MLPRVGFVDADHVWLLFLDELAKPLVLRVVRRGDERVDAVVIEPADRIPLDRLAAAGVVEHENRPPPRGEIGERCHRVEDRIFVVFASGDDPHVDPFARHQRPEKGVEALLEPGRDQRVLLAMGEDALRRVGIGDRLLRRSGSDVIGRSESDGFSHRWIVRRSESDGFSRRWIGRRPEGDGFRRRQDNQHRNQRISNVHAADSTRRQRGPRLARTKSMSKHLHRLPPQNYRGFHGHFLTACSFRRRPAFRESDLCEAVRAQLFLTAAKSGFAVIAYCFMPDHVHVLVAGERPDADFVKWINLWRQQSGYWERKRTGLYLWQEGYWDYTLRDEDSIPAICAYIVWNPVRAGLVDAPDQYSFTGSTRYTMAELTAVTPQKPGR